MSDIKLDRSKVTFGSVSKKESAEKAVALSEVEAFSFVWELTKEVYSLTGEHDVESRLQRHVVSLNQKQR